MPRPPLSAIHGGGDDDEEEASEELPGATAAGSPLLSNTVPAPFGPPFMMPPMPAPAFAPMAEAAAPRRTSAPPPTKRAKLAPAGGAGPSGLGDEPPATTAVGRAFCKGPRHTYLGGAPLQGASSPTESGSSVDTPLAAHLAPLFSTSPFGPGRVPFAPLLGTGGGSPFAAAQTMIAIPLLPDLLGAASSSFGGNAPHDVAAVISPEMAAAYVQLLEQQRTAAAEQAAQLAHLEAQMWALARQAEAQQAARAPSGGASGLSSDEAEAVEAMLLLYEASVSFH